MISLALAYLCLDCETVSPPATVCPACASRALVPLAAWLTPRPASWAPDLGPAEPVS